MTSGDNMIFSSSCSDISGPVLLESFFLVFLHTVLAFVKIVALEYGTPFFDARSADIVKDKLTPNFLAEDIRWSSLRHIRMDNFLKR